MYTPQIAQQLEVPPAGAGEETFLSTHPIWVERDEISLVTQCDVVRFRPATVSVENCRYRSAVRAQYSRPADRSVGRNTKSRSRRCANQAASLEHGFRR